MMTYGPPHAKFNFCIAEIWLTIIKKWILQVNFTTIIKLESLCTAIKSIVIIKSSLLLSIFTHFIFAKFKAAILIDDNKRQIETVRV